MSSDPEYDEIRRRIKRKYDNRTEFIAHLMSYVGASIVLWGVLQPQYGWATLSALIMGCWFIGLLVHAVVFWGKEAQEQAIEHAIERERELRYQRGTDSDIKPKRDRLRLTTDGELLEVVDEDEQAAKKR
ncbi:MAG: 2TM domain-containing protein [Anaerolineae bacterium]